jgi:hypothetical protein
VKTRDLDSSAVNVEPVDLKADTWDTVCPDVSAWSGRRCRAFMADVGAPGDSVDDVEEYLQGDGLDLWTPVMTYCYPVPGLDVADAARLQLALPSCTVIVVGDQPCLALTGGGMDLSWEICESYMVLGYLPPVHLSDLPWMAGRGTSKHDRRIIRACLRSCRIVSDRARSTAARLTAMLAR